MASHHTAGDPTAHPIPTFMPPTYPSIPAYSVPSFQGTIGGFANQAAPQPLLDNRWAPHHIMDNNIRNQDPSSWSTAPQGAHQETNITPNGSNLARNGSNMSRSTSQPTHPNGNVPAGNHQPNQLQNTSGRGNGGTYSTIIHGSFARCNGHRPTNVIYPSLHQNQTAHAGSVPQPTASPTSNYPARPSLLAGPPGGSSIAQAAPSHNGTSLAGHQMAPQTVDKQRYPGAKTFMAIEMGTDQLIQLTTLPIDELYPVDEPPQKRRRKKQRGPGRQKASQHHEPEAQVSASHPQTGTNPGVPGTSAPVAVTQPAPAAVIQPAPVPEPGPTTAAKIVVEPEVGLTMGPGATSLAFTEATTAIGEMAKAQQGDDTRGSILRSREMERLRELSDAIEAFVARPGRRQLVDSEKQELAAVRFIRQMEEEISVGEHHRIVTLTTQQ
ncbi:hypothetical protein diail_5272 [Diaporthe ilicicola]|nr:hypothetical protein diail_5272 [Diaporthe ilicicola]